MKKLFFYILLFVSLNKAIGQEKFPITLYFKDSQGRLTIVPKARGYYYPEIETKSKNSLHPENLYFKTGNWTYYHLNGKVSAEGMYENNFRTGLWKQYYDDGSLAEEGVYKNKERSGIWRGFKGNAWGNSKNYIIDYDKGTATYYDYSGILQAYLEFSYQENDLILKKYIYYYPNGNKLIEGNFDEQVKYKAKLKYQDEYEFVRCTGTWISYWENGNTLIKYDFDKGSQELINTQYEKNYKWKSGGTGSGQKVATYLNFSKVKDGNLLKVIDFNNYPITSEATYDEIVKSMENDELYNTQSSRDDPTFEPKRQELTDFKLEIFEDRFSRTGTWENFNDAGIKESVINYNWITNNPYGPAEFYYPNGNIEHKGQYNINGRMAGIWTYYFENGKIKSEQNYDNGNVNGICKFYYETGILKEKDIYINGKINGAVEFYHPNGKLLGKAKYTDGVYIAPEDYFDENGNKILSNGSGRYMTYNVKGKIEYQCNYLNYCRSGKAEWFYDNGQLEESAIYKYSESQKPEGLRWEILSSFDRFGNAREKGTLKNGNGTWLNYAENGNKTETEYVNGVKK
jgi:antitoxin component YwqK of YwqJK toxin-antitoxin module